MIEEPYRWVEAIANRREYIETQLAPGSPIAALSFRDGILFLTIGRARQKLFEIYDRIAMGAIGHPGDIERLRMAAIELASTEGFTRSAADVSLRRLAFYSLSPLLKTAFEQIYGAPYLARMIFAEVGAKPADDLFLRVEYDGAIAANGLRRRRPASKVQRDQRDGASHRTDGGIVAARSRFELHSEGGAESRARCLERGQHGGERGRCAGITVARSAPSASDGGVAERDDRSGRAGTKWHERDSLPPACW